LKKNNDKKGRFIIYHNGVFAGEMMYVWTGTSKFIIDHTRVKENFSERGLGKLLVVQAVEFARDNALKILPLCPFGKRYFTKTMGFRMSALNTNGSFDPNQSMNIRP
jgi:uncharacterized protein